MSPFTIIFIGPQGSGKGTQIQKLDQAIKAADSARRVIDIQTGRRFRALAAKGEGYTERRVGQTLDSGILQPLFLSVVLWGDAMREHLDEDSHVLIDGFPRTVDEARVLESALNFYKRDSLTIINLTVPEDVARQRMQSRARADDTSESIEARLQWYRDETLPVIEYYKDRPQTVIHDIDATADIDTVQTRIREVLQLSDV